MILKAIVEEVIDKYTARVRIPRYDMASTSAVATKKENLSIAPISSPPGIYPSLAVGDIVFVEFENDLIDSPVIIGELFRNEGTKSKININSNSLVVDVNCVLPEDTKIGSITSTEINSLKNIDGNIQSQLKLLESRIAALEEK